jgi:hypothetical protein
MPISAAKRHECRRVERAHPDDPHIVARRGKHQLAAVRIGKIRLGNDAEAGQQRQRLLEDAALWQGEG